MKTGLKLALLFVSICLLFCSCDFATGELKNRLIIQAIGIDALENGRVRVTLQTLNTEMAGNPNSGSNRGDIIQSMTLEGDTIAAAVSEAARSVGKMPLLVQNRVVVFGKETAKAGASTVFGLFRPRSGKSRDGTARNFRNDGGGACQRKNGRKRFGGEQNRRNFAGGTIQFKNRRSAVVSLCAPFADGYRQCIFADFVC